MKLIFRFNDLIYFETSLNNEYNCFKAFIDDYHNNSVQIYLNLVQKMPHSSLLCLLKFVFNFDCLSFNNDSFLIIGLTFLNVLSVALYQLLQSSNLLKMNLGDFFDSHDIYVTLKLFWPQLIEFRGQNSF